MLKKYLSLQKEFTNNEIKMKKYFLNLLISFLIALFIFSGPMFLLYNLVYFYEFIRLTVYGIVIIVALLIAVWRKLYLEASYPTLRKKELWFCFAIEGLFLIILFTIGYFISWIWW